ncbi:unnamed protein product [Dovyalis caffra]|uniref:Uncharacterized protein n=1 Tax=Dovyalis caffra TaxID=77055 RepID=A0AAV1R649_9ROSI|nr:unnamed protein product [Dovyalis caffra]
MRLRAAPLLGLLVANGVGSVVLASHASVTSEATRIDLMLAARTDKGKVVEEGPSILELCSRRDDHMATAGALLISLDGPAEPKDREAGLHRRDGLRGSTPVEEDSGANAVARSDLAVSVRP